MYVYYDSWRTLLLFVFFRLPGLSRTTILCVLFEVEKKKKWFISHRYGRELNLRLCTPRDIANTKRFWAQVLKTKSETYASSVKTIGRATETVRTKLNKNTIAVPRKTTNINIRRNRRRVFTIVFHQNRDKKQKSKPNLRFFLIIRNTTKEIKNKKIALPPPPNASTRFFQKRRYTGKSEKGIW